MTTFNSLLDQYKYSDHTETLALLGSSHEYQTLILKAIKTIYGDENSKEIQTGIEKFIGTRTKESDEDYTIYEGIVNYFYFSTGSMTLNVYGIIALNQEQTFPIPGEVNVVLVVDLREVERAMERPTEQSELGSNDEIANEEADDGGVPDKRVPEQVQVADQPGDVTVASLLRRWKRNLSQLQLTGKRKSLSIVVVGCDRLEYSFRSMEKIDKIQQCLRVINMEENGEDGKGCLVYLKNWGDDIDKVETLTQTVLDGRKGKIEMEDYESIYIPSGEDSFGKIRTVNEGFDCEHWRDVWRNS